MPIAFERCATGCAIWTVVRGLCFVDSLLHIPANHTYADLRAMPSVRATTQFSYNGCVAQNEGDSNFASSDWRVYLDVSKELWNNDHDTIRLLDSQGEVVAVTSY